VTAVRDFSMSASLKASTVTPGNKAPLVSLTDPAMLLCAQAAAGSTRTNNAVVSPRELFLIDSPPSQVCQRTCVADVSIGRIAGQSAFPAAVKTR
jgi:hypothetical protein